MITPESAAQYALDLKKIFDISILLKTGFPIPRTETRLVYANGKLHDLVLKELSNLYYAEGCLFSQECQPPDLYVLCIKPISGAPKHSTIQ